MAEAKHTPGPWMVSEHGSDEIYFSEGYTEIGDGVGLRVYTSAVEADARLIAAAPELLEALRDVEAALLAIPCTDPSCSCTRRLLPKVQASIAKAEGR